MLNSVTKGWAGRLTLLIEVAIAEIHYELPHRIEFEPTSPITGKILVTLQNMLMELRVCDYS
jgi:hypothetical protein